jgi:hypothetical protein
VFNVLVEAGECTTLTGGMDMITRMPMGIKNPPLVLCEGDEDRAGQEHGCTYLYIQLASGSRAWTILSCSTAKTMATTRAIAAMRRNSEGR